MWDPKLKASATVLATVAVIAGGLLAQPPLGPKPASPVAVPGAESKPAG